MYTDHSAVKTVSITPSAMLDASLQPIEDVDYFAKEQLKHTESLQIIW